MMTQKPKYDQRLLLEQVKQLYEQSHIASLGAVAVSIGIGFVLWALVPHAHLALWVFAAITITLIRHCFIIRFRRMDINAEDVGRWKKLFLLLIFISGTIWGSSAILIFPATSFPHQLLLSFFLVGMVSGGISTFSTVLPAFIAFTFPALLPIISVFLNAGTLIQQSMGLMILLYLAFASMIAYHMFNKNLTTLKLRFENIDLIHFLEEEKHRADAINKDLKEEVGQRKRIEKTLKKHREDLEIIVDERTNALKKSNIDLKIEMAERKQLEKQLLQAQKIEAIGTMAAGIAHDFNNILSGIQGNTSLALLNIDAAHEHYNKFNDIESYVSSGTELTRQLLDFASSKTGDQQPIDINQLINDTATMFCRTKKGLRLHTAFNSINKVIEADSGQIHQVLLNLLVNAWQAMPKGGDINIVTEDRTFTDSETVPYKISPGAFIKITISDSGFGMAPSVMSKIFDPFFTTKKKEKGTGLGLSSVYGIIKNHDGHIRVDSQPDNGSTFHIYLPASPQLTKNKLPADDAIVSGMETILMIDDEPDLLDIGRAMLEALGYHVHCARNGKEAIQFYTHYKNKIDLILLDMIMPGMNGEEVYDRLVEINPDVKVLLSSGYSQTGPIEKILQRGCNKFIQKPFKIQRLSQTIREILNPPV
ncbi:MAG: response regulator [Desulfobacteraceae bacterium]|nr:response regulator [Desulfobacteraceae bacterium]